MCNIRFHICVKNVNPSAEPTHHTHISYSPLLYTKPSHLSKDYVDCCSKFIV